MIVYSLQLNGRKAVELGKKTPPSVTHIRFDSSKLGRCARRNPWLARFRAGTGLVGTECSGCWQRRA